MLVLGLFNGSSGGQAVAESRDALRGAGRPAGLRDGLRQARAQLVAFAVNATRGSPSASLIGVPELLSAQTDIASFTSERGCFSFALLLGRCSTWRWCRLPAAWSGWASAGWRDHGAASQRCCWTFLPRFASPVRCGVNIGIAVLGGARLACGLLLGLPLAAGSACCRA